MDPLCPQDQNHATPLPRMNARAEAQQSATDNKYYQSCQTGSDIAMTLTGRRGDGGWKQRGWSEITTAVSTTSGP